ncbi:ribose-phosphate pyrophosphokinase [Myxococcota bacterium]|nr:ribose-phosphate pyrophosphokinase [Myxococcota bacterium]MBU1431377.1 ribose-phosphate pyrophosphokinase [Myxococcota bacterium]MBU1896963.1 ribose-phosphate pyrophosphokinase [Myxococcota bacterium]
MSAVKLFTGNSNPELAQEISRAIGLEMGAARVGRFSDGEIRVEIDESVRGADAYVIQSTCAPVNDNLMELLIMLDALKRASAGSVSAVIPYFGYARQDRKASPRAPISARLVTDLLEAAGVNRLITMELHAGQIQGFFDGPVDHLYASPVLTSYIQTLKLKNPVVVSPDAGGVERARAFAKRFHASLAIIDKRRPAPNVAEIMNIIGDVEGCDAVLFDDMIDTAGTISESALVLKRFGARRVFAVSTHPVLSGQAIQRLEESPLEEVIVTNTIPLSHAGRACSKIKVISVAEIFGEAILRIHNLNSVSTLFD